MKANQHSSKEEKSAEVNDDDETKMDVDPEPEAGVKSEDDKHLPDECIVMQKTNLPQEPPAVDSPNNGYYVNASRHLLISLSSL